MWLFTFKNFCFLLIKPFEHNPNMLIGLYKDRELFSISPIKYTFSDNSSYLSKTFSKKS